MLALLTFASILPLVYAKTVTQLFSLDPVNHLAFSKLSSSSFFLHGCGQASFLVASVNVDGASLSFAFKGTGITLNVLTDADRGRYQIALDGQSTTVSGITATQTCTPIFSQNGLPYGDHVLSVVASNQTLPSGAMSAKLEFLSIDYTVPDDQVSTGPSPPQQTSRPASGPPSAQTSVSSDQSSAAVVDSGALPPGTIAGIVISSILFIVALVLSVLLYKARQEQPGTQGFKPQPLSPYQPTPYTSPNPYGTPEMMVQPGPHL